MIHDGSVRRGSRSRSDAGYKVDKGTTGSCSFQAVSNNVTNQEYGGKNGPLAYSVVDVDFDVNVDVGIGWRGRDERW